MTDARILLAVFEPLREQIPRRGVAEYLLALRALETGYGTSRAEPSFLCQTLWAKSREERQLVADTLDAVLPEPLTDADLAVLRRTEPAASPATEREAEPEGPRPSADVRTPDAPRDTRPPGSAPPTAAASAAPAPTPVAAVDERTLRLSPTLRRLRRFPIYMRPDVDFTVSLPNTNRQMSRAGRF